jgi:threonine/homoserine/homoserine lactone efflux protein
MGLTWLTLYSVAVAKLGELLTGTARRALDALTAIVLVALGLRVATEKR